MSLEKKLEADLQALQQLQVLRSLPSPSDYKLVDFTSNDFLSLTSYEPLRRHFLQKLAVSRDVLGSGGSRLLVNGTAHNALEERLKAFFCAPAALLFNSGFDANVGFFSCIPHEGDVVVYDEYIHASVRDGIQASRARGKASKAFSHNSMRSLREVLERFIEQRPALRTGEANVIVAVESLYSMDGTFAPLVEIVGLVESLFPAGNGHVIVDEAHTTGLYGQDGRGLVSSLGLEGRVLARLHTFGKALGSSGGTSTYSLPYTFVELTPDSGHARNACHQGVPFEPCPNTHLHDFAQRRQHCRDKLLLRHVRERHFHAGNEHRI